MDGKENIRMRDSERKWSHRASVAYYIRDISMAMWQVVLPVVALVVLSLSVRFEQWQDPAVLMPAGSILAALAAGKLVIDRRRGSPPRQ